MEDNDEDDDASMSSISVTRRGNDDGDDDSMSSISIIIIAINNKIRWRVVDEGQIHHHERR